MSKRKAFWGDSGIIERHCPQNIDGELFLVRMGKEGLQFKAIKSGNCTRVVPWAELHRLASEQKECESMGPLGFRCSMVGPHNVHTARHDPDGHILEEWYPEVSQGGVRTDAVDEKSSPTDSLHGPLNESAPLRILPVEDEP